MIERMAEPLLRAWAEQFPVVALLGYVREGQAHRAQHGSLACNLDDLRGFVDSLTARFVQIQFIKENLTLTG